MKPFRLIVAGTRELDRNVDAIDLKTVIRDNIIPELQELGYEITEIITGDAPRGADQFAYWIGENLRVPVTGVPAEWEQLDAPGAVIKSRNGRRYNARAGYDRNMHMAARADGVVALWDGKSRGTQHMILCAREEDLRVWVVNRRLPRGK